MAHNGDSKSGQGLEAQRLTRSRKLIYAAVTAATLLLLIEAAVRISLPYLDFVEWKTHLAEHVYSRPDRGDMIHYVYDPHYNFKLEPGSYRTKNGELWEINELGLRGPVPAQKKAPGSVRVLVLGASATFNGSPVTGVTWPELLERRLEARTGLDCEVINAATPGYTLYQSGRRLRFELMDYEPDLVIVNHLWNGMKLFALEDPEEMIALWEVYGKDPDNVFAINTNQFLRTVTRWSQAVAYFRSRIILAHLKRARLMQEGRLYQDTDHEATPAGLAFFRRNLEYIVETVVPRGIPLVIVKQATLVRPDNTPRERAKIQYRYVGMDHEALVAAYTAAWAIEDELCRQPGVFCLDAAAHVPPTLEYFTDAVHLTDPGREALAEYLDDGLARRFGDMREFAGKPGAVGE